MSTIQEIADYLRACNFEHCRAVLEPDDVMVLLDYLESQGFKAPSVVDAELEALAPEVVETPKKKVSKK